MKAFLVYGPESSGNRLVHRILIEMGCLGDGGHVQEFDSYIPKPTKPIVWGRSVPSDYIWPNIRGEIHNVQLNGYDPVGIVLFRDWYAMSRSQLKQGRVRTLQHANQNIKKAYEHIFNELVCPYIILSYENIILHPQETVKILSETFGLPYVILKEKIADGNKKYYDQLNVQHPFYEKWLQLTRYSLPKQIR